jgi:tetratricopeptide (TPR) repeat protein
MSEPTSSSERSAEMLKQIEADPLNPASWEELVKKVRGQNDPLSIKSLEIIIEGLKRIQDIVIIAAEKNQPPPQISSLSKGMFKRLAKAYNSPTLLKEAGLIYLRDLNMPDIALQHFERSMRLGGPEKELRPLSEAAAVATQRQLAMASGQGAGHSGIVTAQHAKPIAPNIIKKTGKLLMPSRFSNTGLTKLTETAAAAEAGAPEPLPKTTAECLSEAEAAIAKGQLLRAQTLLRKADEDPARKSLMWKAWTDLGQAAYEAGLSAVIETSFLQALGYDPSELASHFNLALGYHLNNKFEPALVEYLRAIQINGKHPKVWCNLGVLYFQMDQYTQAEGALREAVKYNPEYTRAWDNLAAALGAQDKLDDALIACKKAVEQRPNYPEAYFKMGVIYFSQSEWQKAIEEFQRAAELPALAAYANCFEAMVHSRLEQSEAAEAAVQRAVKADSKCDMIWMAWNDLGQAFFAAGDYTRAATSYGEATMIKPDEPEAWFNLGVSYHQGGDLKTARDSYQQAVDLREAQPGAWHNLGIVCAQMNDYSAAMKAFRQEVHWDPENVRAWYDLGVALEKLDHYDQAAIAFSKVDGLSRKMITATQITHIAPAE